MAQEILQKILDGKVIAIVRGIGSKDIVKLAEAMEKGGINCIEVTFDQTSSETIAETKKSIAAIKEHLGDRVYVGAGHGDDRGAGAYGCGGRRRVYHLPECERGCHPRNQKAG